MFTLDEAIYIICTDKKSDWWQIRTRDTQIVLSARETKERILESVKNLVRTYKTAFNLHTCLCGINERMNPIEIERKELEYKNRDKKLDVEVESIVENTMKELKDSKPAKIKLSSKKKKQVEKRQEKIVESLQKENTLTLHKKKEIKTNKKKLHL